LQSALQQAQAAVPGLQTSSFAPSGPSPLAAAALQLLNGQSHNLQSNQQQPSVGSDLSAATVTVAGAAAAAVAAAGRPSALHAVGQTASPQQHRVMLVNAPPPQQVQEATGTCIDAPSMAAGCGMQHYLAPPSAVPHSDGGASSEGSLETRKRARTNGSGSTGKVRLSLHSSHDIFWMPVSLSACQHLHQTACTTDLLAAASLASSQMCSNCHTTATPFWRKDRVSRLPLCNACGYVAMRLVPAWGTISV
jgi:hypothetical protein